MTQTFDVGLPLESAYRRSVLFAVEVLDALTLERVSKGLKVTAKGLSRAPILNSGGLFVWLVEGAAMPQEIVVEAPGAPFEGRVVPQAGIALPLTRVLLSPRRDYPFAPGATGVQGMLVESRPPVTAPATPPDPVQDATVWLQWLDDDGLTWRDSPVRSRVDEHGGFAGVLRLRPDELPKLDAAGVMSARLAGERAGAQLVSSTFPLPLGRVADALPIFAWDEFL